MNAETGLRAQQETQQVFHDQALLVTAPDGAVRAEGMQGFYYANTRLLSCFELQVDGRPPLAVQVHPARADLLVAYYHDPRLTEDEEQQDRSLLVQLTVAVGSGFHLDLDLRNHSLSPLAFELALHLAADFADLEELRRGRRQQQADVRRTWNERSDELRFAYLHPGLREAVTVRFSSPPRCGPEGVTWSVALAPQEEWHTCIALAPTHEGRAIEPSARCYGDGQSPSWLEAATKLETPADSVRRAYKQAVEDLGALALHKGPPAERPAFAAGIPHFQNSFGRDLLTTSWQALLATPRLLESAILVCERYQGTVYDDYRDEQPGRIIQQVRSGPLNLLGLNPRGRYYSDYASPVDFLIMLGQHFMWTADGDFLRARLPAARRVLDWLERDGDLDGDGFYEYRTRSPMGDRNQGWKDSPRAIPHADGSDAPLPLATSEVQGYAYAGKQQLGAALLALGHLREGARLLREAGELKRRFDAAFWMPEVGFLALALDGQKRQVCSIASNAGHCLATGIVAAEHAPPIAGRLLAPDLFTGWGVRTLSSEHPAYNPFSYHLGSVWTVEQATIAFGLKRYGFGQHANDVARGTYDLAERYSLHRLPEAVGGLPRDKRHPLPGLYPQACWPQAWSAGAVIMMLQAILGLRPLAPLGVLLVYPELPAWLPEVTLRGLRVGRGTLTLQFRRQRDGSTEHRVLAREGRVRVLREPPDSSVKHGWPARVGSPLVSLLHGDS